MAVQEAVVAVGIRSPAAERHRARRAVEPEVGDRGCLGGEEGRRRSREEELLAARCCDPDLACTVGKAMRELGCTVLRSCCGMVAVGVGWDYSD